jgi:N-acetyl sugar amidotransferase
MLTCKKCIMNNVNDPDLVLDSEGICNHCRNFEKAIALIPKGDTAKKYFDNSIAEIKAYGKGKKYDCLIGISGGVDSTYLAYLAKQNGLRALMVHCDNGWNSEISVQNIEKLCAHTGYDLYTLVLDWEEFRDIQLSFFKAGVVDIELAYDYALIATSFKAAIKHNIKYILSGHNIATEGTYMPKSWRQDKEDIINIKAIHGQFGKVPFKTFPKFSFIKQRMMNRRFAYKTLLNYVHYNKEEVKKIIAKETGWVDYGQKHYENVFTRFYQGYLLPEKFKINKRQYHLSVLVQSGQISREQALAEDRLPLYDPEKLKHDKEYVIKKLGFTEKSFDEYMKAPIKKHSDYPTLQKYWDVYFKMVKVLKPFKKLLGK